MKTGVMFYCCDNTLNTTDAFADKNMMLSGGMVWNIGSDGFSFTVPECRNLFVDSGGFQATQAWDMSYPYEPKQLFEWAESIGADYVAAPDFACEPELHESSVEHRMARTVEEHAYAYSQYDSGDYSFDLIPVLQGYYKDQYERCVDWFEREGLIRDYMAIGTVCKRDSVDEIDTVLEAVQSKLPNVEWHMFGMTLNAWKDRRIWGRFRSADTAAWNWNGGTIEEKKELLRKYDATVSDIQRQMNAQTTYHDWT